MEAPVNRHLAKLLSEYDTAVRTKGSNDSIELEIRVKSDITREMYEQLIEEALKGGVGSEGKIPAYITNPRMDLSVNIISAKVHGTKDMSQSIRRVEYVNGVPTNTTYIQKTRILTPVNLDGYLKYSVGLSKETIIKQFPASNDSLVRFKVRVSFDLYGVNSVGTKEGVTNDPKDLKWRLDITAVKTGTLSGLGPILKNIRTDLFTPTLTPQNLLQELNHEQISQYEVEIEYVGKGAVTPADINIVDRVFSLVNSNYTDEVKYQNEIYHVATYISDMPEQFKKPTHRLKQLTNQVVSLSLNTYYNDIYPPTGYYATDKADGKRAVVSMHDGCLYLLLSDGMVTRLGGVGTAGNNSAAGNNDTAEVSTIIADAEFVGNESVFTLYLFDCMVYGQSVSRSGFEIRVKLLEKCAYAINKFLETTNTPSSNGKCVAKKYVMLGETPRELEEGFRQVYNAGTGVDAAGKDVVPNTPYGTDGSIITEPGAGYSATKNYKWKPYENNTIDALAIKCPPKLLGTKPYVVRKAEGLELYLLFVGINHNVREKLGMGFISHYRSMFPEVGTGNYYPIQFSPSANPLAYLYWHKGGEDLNRQIIELGRTRPDETGASEWVFHRVRADRKLEKNYFGNDFRIAELTYLNFVDPFEFESLWSMPASYFIKTASDMYTAPNKFKRFVISLLLKNLLSGARWVVDAAAGRGADLHRYQEIGVENALFIDSDKSAITELIRRKFAFLNAKKRHVRNWIGTGDGNLAVVTRQGAGDIEYDKLILKDTKNLTVHTMIADLRTDSSVLIEKTLPFGMNAGGIDGVVCNFALHYLCGSVDDLRNMLKFVATLLKVDGVFIFTVMSGERVFQELSGLNKGQTWQLFEEGKDGVSTLKYGLKKLYDGTKLAKTGQMISVHLPFSDTMYDEPLCNIDYVIAEAKKVGLSVEMNNSMIDYMDRFMKADRGLYDRLTDDDKRYIELHSYVMLRKVK